MAQTEQAMAGQIEVVPFKMWDRINNFGDAVNPHVLRAVSGASPLKVERGEHLLAIGSVLQKADASTHLWGTGLMHPGMKLPPIGPGRVHALRGARTQAVLRAAGLLEREVPLGDPGFLVASRLRERLPAGVKGAPVCIIPHHASFDAACFAALRDPSVMLLDMRTRSLDLLGAIMNSEIVLSQSLHGLVFAEAFGKPNAWISSKTDEDWCFKFHDWFSTMAEPQAAPVVFGGRAAFDWRAAAAHARLHAPLIDAEALAAAFPRQILRPIPAEGFVEFEACRAAPSWFVPFEELVPFVGQAPAELPVAPVQDTVQAKARALAKARFRDCAETAYCILGRPEFDREADFRAAERILDARSNVQYAFLARGEALSVREGGPVTDTLMIRPNQDLSFANGRAITITLP